MKQSHGSWQERLVTERTLLEHLQGMEWVAVMVNY